MKKSHIIAEMKRLMPLVWAATVAADLDEVHAQHCRDLIAMKAHWNRWGLRLDRLDRLNYEHYTKLAQALLDYDKLSAELIRFHELWAAAISELAEAGLVPPDKLRELIRSRADRGLAFVDRYRDIRVEYGPSDGFDWLYDRLQLALDTDFESADRMMLGHVTDFFVHLQMYAASDITAFYMIGQIISDPALARLGHVFAYPDDYNRWQLIHFEAEFTRMQFVNLPWDPEVAGAGAVPLFELKVAHYIGQLKFEEAKIALIWVMTKADFYAAVDAGILSALKLYVWGNDPNIS